MKNGLVVVGRDGRVDAVGCGAPSAWIGIDLAQVLREGERERFGRWLEEPQAGSWATSTPFVTDDGDTIAAVLVDVIRLARTSFPPRELVMRAMDLFMEQARDVNVALRVALAEDLPESIDGDADRLAWVLATLIGNALRILERNPRDEHEGAIDIHASYDRDLDQLFLSVRDNGPGMPPETARWLFDPDPSTGRAAGLALLMVRELLIAHGGSIAVDSEVGVGTTFTLRLPGS